MALARASKSPEPEPGSGLRQPDHRLQEVRPELAPGVHVDGDRRRWRSGPSGCPKRLGRSPSLAPPRSRRRWRLGGFRQASDRARRGAPVGRGRPAPSPAPRSDSVLDRTAPSSRGNAVSALARALWPPRAASAPRSSPSIVVLRVTSSPIAITGAPPGRRRLGTRRAPPQDHARCSTPRSASRCRDP